MALNIVLVEPEIPNNTGNIGRLCLAAGANLHLVKPFGFELSDSKVKRAGLDYWKHVPLTIYDNVTQFFDLNKTKEMAFLSSHGTKSYTEIPYTDNMFLIFGKESVGLDKNITEIHQDSLFKIPIHSPYVRSLNLANAVSIVAYEGIKKIS